VLTTRFVFDTRLGTRSEVAKISARRFTGGASTHGSLSVQITSPWVNRRVGRFPAEREDSVWIQESGSLPSRDPLEPTRRDSGACRMSSRANRLTHNSVARAPRAEFVASNLDGDDAVICGGDCTPDAESPSRRSIPPCTGWRTGRSSGLECPRDRNDFARGATFVGIRGYAHFRVAASGDVRFHSTYSTTLPTHSSGTKTEGIADTNEVIHSSR
jgi:hypothetical protein